MDISEAIKRLNELQGDDPENEHAVADDVLCSFLRDSGFEALAIAFQEARDRVGFWYA